MTIAITIAANEIKRSIVVVNSLSESLKAPLLFKVPGDALVLKRAAETLRQVGVYSDSKRLDAGPASDGTNKDEKPTTTNRITKTELSRTIWTTYRRGQQLIMRSGVSPRL
jgi:hypothetical protein